MNKGTATNFTIQFIFGLLFFSVSQAFALSEAEIKAIVSESISLRGPDLSKKLPSDYGNYCKASPPTTPEGIKKFWTNLISSYIYLESANNPKMVLNLFPVPPEMTQKYPKLAHGGSHGYGLMQININTASTFGCADPSKNGLLDPKKNVLCGVQIFNEQVKVNGSIGVSKSNVGNIANKPTPWNDWYPLTPGKAATKLRSLMSQKCSEDNGTKKVLEVETPIQYSP